MFHSPDAAELKKQIESAKAYIKLSHDIGGSGVKVKPDKLPKEVAKEKTLEQIGKALAEVGDYALGFGQEIRLEVHGEVTDLGDVKTVMEVAIEANFAKVQPFLGETVHIRELNDGKYPWEKLISLLVGADYEGWMLLEATTKHADRVAALADQKRLFTSLVTAARKAAA
jgi:sugar phosphate isomerase/epimerase